MMVFQHDLLSLKHLLPIHAGIEVHLIFGVLHRMRSDIITHDLVLDLFTGVIDFRVIDYLHRGLSFYYPYVPVYLRRHVMTVLHRVVARHVIKDDKTMPGRLEPREQYIGMTVIILGDGVVVRHLEMKAASFFFIQELCKN